MPGVKAAADLMLAYEDYPNVFDDNLGIPESGNGVPDVLDEVRYELEWLLKMQDEKSGGVYHKVTTLNFGGMIMPDEENDSLYIMPVSNCATGDFAAAMAMAARVYEKYDKTFADKCLSAAKKHFPISKLMIIMVDIKTPVMYLPENILMAMMPMNTSGH